MTTLPAPRDIAECDRMLADARLVLAKQLERGSIIGLHRIRTTIDDLLDHRNRLVGPPVCGSVPAEGGEHCGRVKSKFGTSVWLCPSCDFRACTTEGCDRKVLSLTDLCCNPCRGIAAT